MCGLGSAEHEQSCVISCSHSPPEGNLSVLIRLKARVLARVYGHDAPPSECVVPTPARQRTAPVRRVGAFLGGTDGN
jgi:hypothetical protein